MDLETFRFRALVLQGLWLLIRGSRPHGRQAYNFRDGAIALIEECEHANSTDDAKAYRRNVTFPIGDI